MVEDQRRDLDPHFLKYPSNSRMSRGELHILAPGHQEPAKIYTFQPLASLEREMAEREVMTRSPRFTKKRNSLKPDRAGMSGRLKRTLSARKSSQKLDAENHRNQAMQCHEESIDSVVEFCLQPKSCTI